MATYYWVGDSRPRNYTSVSANFYTYTWKDPNMWSSTSGGSPGAGYPGRNDDAVFDQYSIYAKEAFYGSYYGQFTTIQVRNLIADNCPSQIWPTAQTYPAGTRYKLEIQNINIYGNISLSKNIVLYRAYFLGDAGNQNQVLTLSFPECTVTPNTANTYGATVINEGFTDQNIFDANDYNVEWKFLTDVATKIPSSGSYGSPEILLANGTINTNGKNFFGKMQSFQSSTYGFTGPKTFNYQNSHVFLYVPSGATFSDVIYPSSAVEYPGPYTTVNLSGSSIYWLSCNTLSPGYRPFVHINTYNHQYHNFSIILLPIPGLIQQTNYVPLSGEPEYDRRQIQFYGNLTVTGNFSIKTPGPQIIVFESGKTFTFNNISISCGSNGATTILPSKIYNTYNLVSYNGNKQKLNYINIDSAVCSPPNCWTATNSIKWNGVSGIETTYKKNKKVIVLTAGTTWTVPSDWNSTSNKIHLIGGGGGGSGGYLGSSSGGGGGGGGYTKIENFSTTPGLSIYYTVGQGGAGVNSTANTAQNGQTTYFNSNMYSAGGGTAGYSASGGAGGVGSTANGGAGGNGWINGTNGLYYAGGGGGGGAGGPYGSGARGGDCYASPDNTPYRSWGGSGGGNGGGGTARSGYIYPNATANFPDKYNFGGLNASGYGSSVTSNLVGNPGYAGGGGGGAGDTSSGSSHPAGTGGFGQDIIPQFLGSGGGGGAANARDGTAIVLQGNASAYYVNGQWYYSETGSSTPPSSTSYSVAGGGGAFGGGGGGAAASQYVLSGAGSNGVIIIEYDVVGASDGNMFLVYP